MLLTGTYWARHDSTSANNNELNPIGDQFFPAEQISFVNDDPDIPGIDTTGDLNVTFNNGAIDPNTMVLIDGVRYPFTVEVIGVTPATVTGNKLPPEYLNTEVVVISVVINGVEEEFFFFPNEVQTQIPAEALMNSIKDGAIPLETFVLTCFCEGTGILTPNGSRPVESIRVGDFLLNDSGVAKQVIWVGRSSVSLPQLRADVDSRPIRIPASALGHACPEVDLLVSSQHRIVVEGAAPTLLFGEDRVLVPAKFLVGSVAERVMPSEPVSYYHVLLEEHELLTSNGLVSESFQPARRTLENMSLDNQRRLLAAIEALGVEEMLTRPDALPSLKQPEGIALGAMLKRMVTQAESTEAPAIRLS